MKIMILGVGFQVEKWLKNSLKRLKNIDFLAKNRYPLPLMLLSFRSGPGCAAVIGIYHILSINLDKIR